MALVGQTALTAQGGGFYQEVDLLSLYKDVAGFLAQLDHPSQVRHLVDRACRTALAHQTVAVLVVPSDIQDVKAVLDPPHSHGHYATSNAPSSRPTVPPEADLLAAAEVLRGGEKVAMLVGQGAYGAEAEVAAIADRLGAGVATALLGMPVVDQREPWVTGSIGLLGTRPSWHLMQNCDRLLIVGSAMPYSEFYPAGRRPRRTDRHRRRPARPALPHPGQPHRRRRADAPGADRAARRPGPDRVAGRDRRAHHVLAEGAAQRPRASPPSP